MLEERKYWSPEIETMPLDKLRELQGERLEELVAFAYEKSPLYRRKLDEAAVKPTDIKTVDDLSKLPLTDDTDIRGKPFPDKLAIPANEIERFHSTSGITTGIPEPIPFSAKDTDNLLDGEAQARWTMGVRPGDVAQVLTNYDWCLMGHERLGAIFLLLNAGRYMLNPQISLTKSAGVTILEQLPSHLPEYFEHTTKMGIDLKETKLRMVIGFGEPWSESYKKKWESYYGIPMVTLWSSMELGTVAAECEARRGMHIFSQRHILEVIDPETGEPVPNGEEGELIVTPLLYRAMPLIRYRIGDIGKILPYEPCPCGRTLPRMGMVRGRISHTVEVGDKKVLPLDVEEIIANIEGLASNYQLIMDRPGVQERLKVKIECRPEVKDLKALQDQVVEALHRELGIESELELLARGDLSSAVFKPQRVIRAH